MYLNRLFHQFLLWRAKYISNRNFILLIAVLIGLCGGLAAIILKTGVHYIQHLLTLGLPARYHNYLYFFYPLIGILLTVFYRMAFRYASFGHGMANLLLAISKRSGIVEPERMYNNIISASLTVGFGGSVGLESPIVTTGAAIGSNLASAFHMGQKKRSLLLGCGVAAGIGGIFNAPITGVIFCMEALMLELSVPAFIPLLISAVTGTIISKAIMGSSILFNYSASDPFQNAEIPFFIVLGILTGLLSIFFLRIYNRTVEYWHNRVHDSVLRAIWGGLALGALIFAFPPLYGEGYDSVKDLLRGENFKLLSESFFLHNLTYDWILLLFVGCVIILKVFASGFTIGAGGNGGTFAPSLTIGGFTGFFVSHLYNSLNEQFHLLSLNISERNFILVGMAGMLSGVLHAPLTAIFLIAEITSGYQLLIPLMIVSAISFVSSSYIEPHSVYMLQLAKKGHIHFFDRDRRILVKLKLKKLLEKDLVSVHPQGTLKDMVDAVSRSNRNIFPVVDEHEKLSGIINLDDIRQIMFKPELYDVIKISEIMHPPPESIHYTEDMETVMERFDRTGAWNLPVVDDNGIFVGILSRAKIFAQYRSKLKQEAKEDTEIIE